ncbi:MAG: DUF255 domain-containing protein [Actinobacteria bacterium]|nr:DUF255 domain-containing protein [Actinomycetota bacterium]
MANRLAGETSPYLLQHKDNPVDWYPWGDEAFSKARDEDKPVLLSIGYAACHWCHVMEHESFEDAETARLMNDGFVSIKVDREERPDIDGIYMSAVQAMTGGGGWPMTMFLTPDGDPFFGGTYFPPVDRHGMPSFKKLLTAISDAWRERRDEVHEQGQKLTAHIKEQSALGFGAGEIEAGIVEGAIAALKASFDPTYGGFGGAPKFPQAMVIDVLLAAGGRGNTDAAQMATTTLDGMAAGGMFDQLAGGFARYSVDPYWLIPHFEKMLYDNAQLLRTYARSWQNTGNARHRKVAEMTARWLLTEMRDPAGGFWSSLDADSEGEEGRFYAFTLDEVRDATGDDFGHAVEALGFTEAGNFEGKSVPVHAAVIERNAEERVRGALLAVRNTRVRPGTDSKVLAGWNGLTAAALAEAGVALKEPTWIAAAAEAMDFVLTTMRVDGRLMRSYRETDAGEKLVKHLGYAEDYAFVLEACLALFEATGSASWLESARWAADEAIRLFASDDTFFTTGTDAPDLITRPKELVDNAVPSANSVLALGLQKIALVTGKNDYEDVALAAMRPLADAAGRSPTGFGTLLGAIDFYTSDPDEIVILGPSAEPLLDVVRERYRPNKILIAPDDAADLEGVTPLVEGRGPVEGKAAAYVCHRGVCLLPVTDPEALREQLKSDRL